MTAKAADLNHHISCDSAPRKWINKHLYTKNIFVIIKITVYILNLSWFPIFIMRVNRFYKNNEGL